MFRRVWKNRRDGQMPERLIGIGTLSSLEFTSHSARDGLMAFTLYGLNLIEDPSAV
jgi:hypothetical protein